jgi:uncharacterized tellurite resistance protein B-like protein
LVVIVALGDGRGTEIQDGSMMSVLFAASSSGGFVVIMFLVLAVLAIIRRDSTARPAKPAGSPLPSEPRVKARRPTNVRRTTQARPSAEPLKRDPEDLARIALHSFEQITNLIDKVGTNEAERQAHREDLRQLIVALVSAVILADGVIHPGEYKFVRCLVRDVESDEQCASIVRFGAEAWERLRDVTPQYFQALVEYDRAHQTRLSRRVLDELVTIVQCTGLSDGDYDDADFQVASMHLARLEAVFKKAIWVVQWDYANEVQRVPLDRSYRRDQFGSKEVP